MYFFLEVRLLELDPTGLTVAVSPQNAAYFDVCKVTYYGFNMMEKQFIDILWLSFALDSQNTSVCIC